MTVSSTDYAPTPAAFAVDGLPQVGVRGTGWRAANGDPQWISVDLQAPCRVEAVSLSSRPRSPTGRSTATTPTPTATRSCPAPRRRTGSRSPPTAVLAVGVRDQRGPGRRRDHQAARAGHRPLGADDRHASAPTPTRWASTASRSTAPPRATGRRPTGWTDWDGGNTGPAPALTVAADGTVPLESGWTLTMDDWAGGDGAELCPSRRGHQRLAARDRARHRPGLPGRPGPPARPGRRA